MSLFNWGGEFEEAGMALIAGAVEGGWRMTPKDCKYTEEHEWVRPGPGDNGKIGITAYAQSQLGDIVFVEFPSVGTVVEKSGRIGEIESVKTVSDLFTPVSGEVVAVNQAVIDDPQLIKDDTYGDGWLVELKLSKPAELDDLMNSETYDTFVAGLD
ncbi:glycine cleavage system protein GcvH [Chloroflexota bacterium]